jgi:hypothetical protein
MPFTNAFSCLLSECARSLPSGVAEIFADAGLEKLRGITGTIRGRLESDIAGRRSRIVCECAAPKITACGGSDNYLWSARAAEGRFAEDMCRVRWLEEEEKVCQL